MMHLRRWRMGYKGETMCGKRGVDRNNIVDNDHIHLVTCTACLREKIEQLERDLETEYEYQAGASL